MIILLVEDDKKIARFISNGLKKEDFAVDVFHNGEDGAYWALNNRYDLMILDIMLPGMNGLEICRRVRKANISTPIIMLTAKDTVEDRVSGLNTGADDYLGKPFSFDELLARIKALFRRANNSENILKAADLEMNLNSRRVFRAGKEIVLTGKEYNLLEYLLVNKNKIITETRIIEHVWDMNFELSPNFINVFIHHLRKIDRAVAIQSYQYGLNLSYKF